jgi:predicted fused transcriptional regulator/phosphomethylpyrimidine kinase
VSVPPGELTTYCAARGQLTELKDETTRVAAAIPELQRFCAQFQRQVADVVAKHGDIQFVFDHYIQVRTASPGARTHAARRPRY